MVNITKETYENNGIEAIGDNMGNLWLNEKHIEEELGHKNLAVVTIKCDPVYKKHRYESRKTKKNNQIEDFYVVI